MRLKVSNRRSQIDFSANPGTVTTGGNLVVDRTQGQSLALKTKTTHFDIADNTQITISTVTATASSWIPAGAFVIGLVARVTATLTGAAANVSIGYTGATTVFANA